MALQIIDSTILFGSVIQQLNSWFENHSYSSIHVLCDENTFRNCWPRLDSVEWPSPPIIINIPPGELEKNLKTCETVWDIFLTNSVDRNSLLINLGGGVVTDLGGFCAASYMRGIKFLHVPTTVLAMTDAAIGGKHGVDFKMYKNYIGTFAEPDCIVIDIAFIESLTPRETRSGVAEIIKHGFLADPELIRMLRSTELNAIEWNQIIRRSIEVKLSFAQNDIYDRGVRAALNFGHTIGHAIETSQLTSGSPLRHGEAVALGMLVEALISVKHVGLSSEDFDTIEDTIHSLFPGLSFPEISTTALQNLIVRDKKKSGADVLFSLLKTIGEPVVGQKVPSSIVNEAYLHYNS